MVLACSDRIPRVPPYSGYPRLLNRFVYGPFTLFRAAFQLSSTTILLSFLGPSPRTYYYLRFGLLRFRSPLLSESLVYFLFLWVLRWFSSPGSPLHTMYSCTDNGALPPLCFHIQKSSDHRLFASPRRLSQLITSFIGA